MKLKLLTLLVILIIIFTTCIANNNVNGEITENKKTDAADAAGLGQDLENNEIIKVNRPRGGGGSGGGRGRGRRNWEIFPNSQEKKLEQDKGCSNGEKTYFDGCNRCSCPHDKKPIWCGFKVCWKKQPKRMPTQQVHGHHHHHHYNPNQQQQQSLI